MSNFLLRVINNLQRPVPDLISYVLAKASSFFWKKSISSVGYGFYVGSGSLIQGGKSISIGNNFKSGKMLWIEAVQRYGNQDFTPCIEIGNSVTCSQSVHIAAIVKVSIGDGVMFGSRIHVTDHAHGRYHGNEHDSPELAPGQRPLAFGRPVFIHRNVWLADGVVVLPGVTIGEGCIVGANSVVSRSLPPNVIAVGAPAVPIKRYESESGCWIPLTFQT
jgi:acetyltransferase-like isoleucine patch superfamily enzyme